MDIVLSIVGFVCGACGLYLALVMHQQIDTQLQDERRLTMSLRTQIIAGQTIITDSVVAYIREERSFLDKDLVISRLRDAAMGLGYYPKDGLKAEPTGDSESPDTCSDPADIS